MTIDGTTGISLVLVLGLLGSFIMFGRWQGRIDEKLTNFLSTIISIEKRVEQLEITSALADNRIIAIETRCKFIHRVVNKKEDIEV